MNTAQTIRQAVAEVERLREESRAMIGYFRLMRERGALLRQLEQSSMPEKLLGAGQAVTPEAMQRQMMKDYVTLAGRSGPAVPGESGRRETVHGFSVGFLW